MRKSISAILLIFLSPVILLISIVIRLTSKGPIIFRQKRMGKCRKAFVMYKFRTMFDGAERMKKNLMTQNERKHPLFKIKNDPRYTKVGKLLSHTGFDELPQLINIWKGDMDFVGPRPFPIDESRQISKRYNKRFSVLPGIVSLGVLDASNSLTFDEWMQLDCAYVEEKSILKDIAIGLKSIGALLQKMRKIRV